MRRTVSIPPVRDRTLPTWYFDNPFRRWLTSPGRLLDVCGPERGNVVADLGAGGGFFLAELSRRVGPTGRIYAVDIDEAALSMARGIADDLGIAGRVEFVHASAASVPAIPSSSVEYVLSNGVLCCLAQKERAVGEMWRILKPGGRALVTFVTIGPRWTRRGKVLRTSDSRFRQLVSQHSWEVIPGRARPFSRRYILRKPNDSPVAPESVGEAFPSRFALAASAPERP